MYLLHCIHCKSLIYPLRGCLIPRGVNDYMSILYAWLSKKKQQDNKNNTDEFLHEFLHQPYDFLQSSFCGQSDVSNLSKKRFFFPFPLHEACVQQYLSLTGIGNMASDSLYLATVFSDCGVPPAASVAIVSSGWDVDKFALGFQTDTDFDDTEVLLELGLEADFSRLHRAALKQAWNRCVQLCKMDTAVPSEASPKASSASGGIPADTSDGSWSEAFAPKLGGPVIAAMKKKFIASYPAEPLTPETMPSHRLLALVHQSISKSHWKWIPWKYRMSLHKEDELQSTRSSKVPKIENLHLHNILMDEVPSIDISNTTMGLHALRWVASPYFVWKGLESLVKSAMVRHELPDVSVAWRSVPSPNACPRMLCRLVLDVHMREQNGNLRNCIFLIDNEGIATSTLH